MARIRAVLWKTAKCIDGEYPVYLRIEAGSRRQYLSLGFRVKPTHWNPKAGEVRKSLRSHGQLNQIIHNNVSDAKDALYGLLADGLEVSPSAIKAAILPTPSTKEDFIAYGNAYAEELRSLGKIPTSRRYFSILRKLSAFTGGRLPFSGVTTQFLRDYRSHLVERYDNGPSTIASNYRALKAINNRAIKDGMIDRNSNPFEGFTVSEPRSAKRILSLDEIGAIRDLDLETESLAWHVRNYFLFSFYCAGIRFRDVCLLKAENVRGGRLNYTMIKTGTPKSIGLVPNAQAIVDAYDKVDRPGSSLAFPLLDGYNLSTPEKLDRAVQSRNTVVNKVLKKLAELASIDANVSFHMSRHSFADFARREGWDVYRISKALGHKDLRVTENYLKGFDRESIDAEMGKLFGGA